MSDVCTRCWFTNGEDGDDHCGSCRCCTTCPDCWHPLDEHSSEPGIGCLHHLGMHTTVKRAQAQLRPVLCPCTRTGTSGADQ